MVGDVDDNKVSSVQNLRSLGGVEAPNSYNDQGRTEGWTEGRMDILCVVQSCFATKKKDLEIRYLVDDILRKNPV